MLMESVKRGWGLVTKNGKLVGALAGLYILIGLVMLPFQHKLQDYGPDPEDIPGGLLAGAFLVYLVVFFVNIFVQGGLLGSAKAFLASGKAGPSDFIANGKRYYTKLLGFTLLLVGAVTGFWVVVFLLGMLLSLVGGGNQAIQNGIFVATAIAAGCLSLVFLLGILFSPFVIVAEDSAVFASVKRSWALSKTHVKGMAFLAGFLIVSGLLLAGVVTLVSLPFSTDSMALAAVGSVINNVLATVFGVLIAGTVMSFYQSLARE